MKTTIAILSAALLVTEDWQLAGIALALGLTVYALFQNPTP